MMMPEEALRLYTRMVQIRKFEERALAEYRKSKIPGSLHLYIGTEAVAVGVCAHLTDADYVTSTHRGHGHCIAKGVDLNRMMAELFGRATGACKGKGGSMHISDFQKGMLGAIPIVGAGAPLACGAALSAKTRGTDQVTACFFGDGASNQGAVLESLNLAAIWKLPVVFVCENNLYAESTPIRAMQAEERVIDKVRGFGLPGCAVDGMDLFSVYEAAGEAVAQARAGRGPVFIECQTYRFCGHFHGDQQAYQLAEEMQAYRQRDSIQGMRRRLVQQGLCAPDALDAIDQEVERQVDAAVAFAEASPYPAPEETMTDVYYSEVQHG